MVSSNAKVSSSRPLGGRMAAVKDMAGYLRALFEVEREFVCCATTLIYRVGDIELKYALCQHVWEAAGHARFIRERGRELSGFGKGEQVRTEIRQLFDEAISPEDALQAVAGFYRVFKPALLAAYESYLEETNHLADWPSSKLVEEFIQDEKRHAQEIEPYLAGVESAAWEKRLTACLQAVGGWLMKEPGLPLPEDFVWSVSEKPYPHPATCNRGSYPVCSSVFGNDPQADPIVRDWLEDPQTDARVVRLMVYVWLMMELDAVDYLATVFYDTRDAPFDLHFDLARHLWDESRHSQFGYRQLPKLGVDLTKLEHSLDLYNILVQMTPAERYAMMTMEFEAGSFPTKAKVMDRVRELNDFEADTLLAFDRNDEQGHVRYGHRWLPEIMKLFGETRPVAEFVAATRIRFEALAEEFGGKTPHSLSPEERVTGSDLLALASKQA